MNRYEIVVYFRISAPTAEEAEGVIGCLVTWGEQAGEGVSDHYRLGVLQCKAELVQKEDSE